MLEELIIQDYALIDRLHLEFKPGMNCLTGETGAGKSILAGALGLLIGFRGKQDSVRQGKDQSIISGVFSMSRNSSELLAWLDERGIVPEENRIVVRRVLKRSGKGSAFIQGSAVNRQDLSDFASYLLDMHGQHEHQSLFSTDMHRRFLDDFAGISEEVERFKTSFLELSQKKKVLETMQADERQRLREIDMLQYAVQEIEEAELKPDEDRELEQEAKILGQSEQIAGLVNNSLNFLSKESNGALAHLSSTRRNFEELSEIDAKMAGQAGRIESLYYELEDIYQDLLSYQGKIVFDPNRLEFVEERLSDIQKLKRKYGDSLTEIFTYYEESKETLDNLENFDQNRQRLEDEIKKGEAKIVEQALIISENRKKAAKNLEESITSVLSELHMAGTQFSAKVDAKLSERGMPLCGIHGMDSVEFLLSANKGEPLRPIRSIASGGELSRIMLAIKTSLLEVDEKSTLVFDEIDTGIGGDVGVAVGDHLHRLSEKKQVLVITHLASIAARADNHIIVEKKTGDSSTKTSAKRIQGEERVDEIARMLSGSSAELASRSHAKELIEQFFN